MRAHHRWVAVGLVGIVATCRPGTNSHRPAARPPTPHTAVAIAESPALAIARTLQRIAGAAPEVHHPNEALPDVDLGVHVVPRNIALPRLTTGRSTRFRFDGDRRGWAVQLAEGAVLSSVAYAHDRVYVGAGFSSTTVYAFDARNGSLKWTGTTPDGGPTAAIVEDDTVMFNTESCTLFAFDRRSGRLRWSRWLGDPLMSQPVAGGGRVFSAYPNAGSPTGFRMAALSVRDGRILWSVPIAADVVTSPVISGDSMYFTTMNGSVYRMNPRNGHTVWSRSMNATSAPTLSGDRVFVAQRMLHSRERQVALSIANGARVFATDAASAPYAARPANTGGVEAGWSFEGSHPSYAEGRLYYAMGNTLSARDAQTGRVVWERHYPHEFAQRGMTSPAVVAGSLVMGTRNGDVFGLDIDSGMTTWAYHVGEPIAFQPTVANGWVYTTTTRGKLVALEVAERGFDGWHMWGGNPQHAGPSAAEPVVATSDDRPSEGTLRASDGAHTLFPLMHTRVHAEVSAFVARVTVEQTFSNPNRTTMHAEYLFPLPPESAVDAMEMHIGARIVRATIDRRAQARARFEHARDCGQHAALLEQERPNLFRQSVANLRAGESIRVTLTFAETVPYHDGTYEFVMPLSTGARPNGPGAGGTPPRAIGAVEIDARIDAGLALSEVASPSHAVAIAHEGAHVVRVALQQNVAAPDRDFVLRYRPRVETAEPSVLAHREGDAGFFTFMLHPNAQAPDTEIQPREIVFAVDTSSSMAGAPLRQSQRLLHRAIDGLRATDAFQIVRFSDTRSSSAPTAIAPTPETRAAAHAFVDAMRAVGTTDITPALHEILARSDSPDRLRIVVLVTDGYVGNERAMLANIERDLGTSRLFTFGVGASPNRYVLEQAAEIGRGHAEVVPLSEDATVAADRFHRHIDRPYLTDVAIDWGGLAVTDVYPRAIPDLFADRPILVHGRYAHGGQADVRIAGRVRGRAWQRTLHVTLPETAHDHEALPSVWARTRIHDLDRAMMLGETPVLRDEITDLGLRFHLVTDYTSFVAVDETHDGSERCNDRVPTRGGHLTGFAIGDAFGYGGFGMTGTGWGGGGASGASGIAYGSAMSVLQGSGSDGARGIRGRGTEESGAGEGNGQGYGNGTGRSLASREVSAPQVRTAPPQIFGSLSPDSLRRTVLRNLGQVRHCYEMALGANPQLRGRIVLRVVIDGLGRVSGSAVAEDTLGVTTVGQCIAQAARSWVFAGPPDGSIVTMSYPFTFEPPAATPTVARPAWTVPFDS